MPVNSFKGVTRAQQQLLDVWTGLARQSVSGLPRKCDLDPGLLRQQLSRLSILELTNGEAPRFRLAGSRLSELVGVDPTGLRPCDLPAPHGDMFELGIEPILHGQGPIGGLCALEEGGVLQSWLRLPLADIGGTLRFVLCHDDVFLTAAALVAEQVPGAIHIEPFSIAA